MELLSRFRAWLDSPRARATGSVPRWAAAGALVALAFAGYWSSLWGDFLYDDIHTIRDNPGVRGLAAFWQHLPYQLHRPLLFLTFALNYEAGGLDPFVYHLTNVALHALNAVLVMSLALAFIERGAGFGSGRLQDRAAWLAAALFALHPAGTEAVAYVSSRSSLLATTFVLGAVWLFTRELTSDERARPWWRALGMVSFLAAMATKEIAVATPLLLLCVDRCFVWREHGVSSWRDSMRRVTPHLGLLLAGAAVRVMLQHAVKTTDVTWSLLDHWRTELGAWPRYPQLLLLPINLNADPAIAVADRWSAREWLGLVGLVGSVVAAWALSRRVPLASLAIGWFLIALTPTSLIPLQDFIAERRLYLAMPGPLIAIGAGLALLGEHLAWSRRMSAATLALLTFLGLGTVARNRVWSSSLALWTDTVRKSPDKARPHGNLATALGKAGNLDAAFAHYERALALNPELVEYRINRANLFRVVGRYDDALAELDRVIAAKPADDRLLVAAWHQTGEVYLAKHDYERALQVFLDNAGRSPLHPETYLRIGRIHFLRGDLVKAEQAFLESIHRFDWDPAGHRSLAFVYYRTGRQKDAVRELKDALRADPTDEDARVALAEIRAGRPLKFD